MSTRNSTQTDGGLAHRTRNLVGRIFGSSDRDRRRPDRRKARPTQEQVEDRMVLSFFDPLTSYGNQIVGQLNPAIVLGVRHQISQQLQPVAFQAIQNFDWLTRGGAPGFFSHVNAGYPLYGTHYFGYSPYAGMNPMQFGAPYTVHGVFNPAGVNFANPYNNVWNWGW